MPIEMPEIATTSEVATYLRIGSKTVSNYASEGLFVPGVYLCKNKFNMTLLKAAIQTPPYKFLLDVRDRNFCKDRVGTFKKWSKK